MRRSNCFLASVVIWWRWRKQGAYWACRRTRHMPIGLHWLVYHPRYKTWVHYEPTTIDDSPQVLWVKLFYRGKLKRGDR